MSQPNEHNNQDSHSQHYLSSAAAVAVLILSETVSGGRASSGATVIPVLLLLFLISAQTMSSPFAHQLIIPRPQTIHLVLPGTSAQYSLVVSLNLQLRLDSIDSSNRHLSMFQIQPADRANEHVIIRNVHANVLVCVSANQTQVVTQEYSESVVISQQCHWRLVRGTRSCSLLSLGEVDVRLAMCRDALIGQPRVCLATSRSSSWDQWLISESGSPPRIRVSNRLGLRYLWQPAIWKRPQYRPVVTRPAVASAVTSSWQQWSLKTAVAQLHCFELKQNISRLAIAELDLALGVLETTRHALVYVRYLVQVWYHSSKVAEAVQRDIQLVLDFLGDRRRRSFYRRSRRALQGDEQFCGRSYLHSCSHLHSRLAMFRRQKKQQREASLRARSVLLPLVPGNRRRHRHRHDLLTVLRHGLRLSLPSRADIAAASYVVQQYLPPSSSIATAGGGISHRDLRMSGYILSRKLDELSQGIISAPTPQLRAVLGTVHSDLQRLPHNSYCLRELRDLVLASSRCPGVGSPGFRTDCDTSPFIRPLAETSSLSFTTTNSRF